MDSDLKGLLSGASREGIITEAQAEKLLVYIDRGRSVAAEGIREPVGDTETPRFVRGFHDVLITIGIVIVLAGIWGVGTFYAALPAIVILAEVLVRRQRLALPAVALTVAFVQWIAVVTAFALDVDSEGFSPIGYALFYVLPFPVLLAVFHWRYRVPLSLALFFVSACSLGLILIFYLIQMATGDANFVLNHPTVTSVILLAAALALFALALSFDLRDPARQTRSSDVAFWLHLGAAPVLLYAMLSFVFMGGISDLGTFPENAGNGEAFMVVVIVTLFMGIGLVIDRRAFVTSGLLSLGFAIYKLFETADMELDVYIFVTLLIVGLVVLTIGVGWPWFRRIVVSGLPQPLKEKLPPLR